MNPDITPMPPKKWIEEQINLVLDSEKVSGDNLDLAKRITGHLTNNWQMICLMREGRWNIGASEKPLASYQTDS